jgi:hypothetical protein
VSVLPRFTAARTVPPVGKIRITSSWSPPRWANLLQVQLGYCDLLEGFQYPESAAQNTAVATPTPASALLSTQLIGVAWGNAKACNSQALGACQAIVMDASMDCEWSYIWSRCGPECLFQVNRTTPRCGPCIAQAQAGCTAAYTLGMQKCTNDHGCPVPGTDCVDDDYKLSRLGEGTCCPKGQHACAAHCLTLPCAPPRVVFDKSLCSCRCPSIPCVGGQVNPNSCVCECPAGQKLCNGKCTDLCTDSNCRDCGDQMPVGFKCCPGHPPTVMNCTPTFPGTNANCKDCGDTCIGGEQCINGTCACPSGRDPCPSALVRCCPQGQTCCDGSCVNPKTNRQHCNGCNNPCPLPQVCTNGQCVCPSGRQPCGLTPCCRVGEVCCGGDLCFNPNTHFCCTDAIGGACPIGQTCCNGQATCGQPGC